MSSRAIVVRPGEGHRVGNVEFLARTADTPRFTFAIIEIQAGRVLEAHTHEEEDDAFLILEGELTFDLDDGPVAGRAGHVRARAARGRARLHQPRLQSPCGCSTSTRRLASTGASGSSKRSAAEPMRLRPTLQPGLGGVREHHLALDVAVSGAVAREHTDRRDPPVRVLGGKDDVLAAEGCRLCMLGPATTSGEGGAVRRAHDHSLRSGAVPAAPSSASSAPGGVEASLSTDVRGWIWILVLALTPPETVAMSRSRGMSANGSGPKNVPRYRASLKAMRWKLDGQSRPNSFSETPTPADAPPRRPGRSR